MRSLPLTIHLFGPMRILVQGEPLPRVRTRSVEWLLALLLLRYGRTVDRSWLAGTLWLDSEESQALRNLREDLVRLRKALGGESARLQGPSRDTLTFDLVGAEVDLIAFDAGIRSGDEAALRGAVALYTGPLLEGCHEPWVTLERRGREQACLTGLEALAAFAQQRGDWSESLSLLRRAEGLDGLRDSIQRGLMRVLAASGDVPTALMVYREHRLRLHREINIEPDDETTRLFQQLRNRDESSAGRTIAESRKPSPSSQPPTAEYSARSPLPHLLPRLIGREEAVREVVRQVAASRLVTLVGTGGVGKTSLSIEVAHEAAQDFPHGTAFVALASLSDSALLPSFVASALGIREEGNADAEPLLQTLVNWLSLHPVLLVLDNCEHLIEATAALCQTLLQRCAPLHILATSRQRLGLTGELVWRVPSLPSPDPQYLPFDGESAAYVLQYPAVQLFVERASMIRSGFQIAGREQAQAVARICRRLDGIPLAIELAAARVGLLTLDQIAARLEDRFRLLTGGSRGVLTRHQTLRALIDWSYELLDAAERLLLRRLSVFSDGWTLEAAENQNEEVLDLLTSLVDKSLVLVEEHPGSLRYRLLETVREYALEELRESGEEATARNAHLAYFVDLAQEFSPAPRGSDLEEALGQVELEVGNFREALRWAQTEAAPPAAFLRLAAALWPFWEVRGHHTEGREHLRVALNRPGSLTNAPERAQALLGTTTLAFVQVDWAVVLSSGRESVEAFRALADPRGLGASLLLLGYASARMDALPSSRALLTEALAHCRECGWNQGIVLALTYLGMTAEKEHDLTLARSLWEEGIELAEAADDSASLALSLHYTDRILGHFVLETGDCARLCSLLEQSLLHWRRLGDKHKAALTLCTLGDISRLRQRDPVMACNYYEEAVAVWREQGNRNRLAAALHEMGNALYEQDEFERARSVYAESVRLFDQVGEDYGRDFARMNLGNTLFRLGEAAQAQAFYAEALRIYQRKAFAEGIAWALERMAAVEAVSGDVGRAAKLLGAAALAREAIGQPVSRPNQAQWDQAIATTRATLGEAVFEHLWAEGRSMTQEQAIMYALTNG